MEIGNQMQNHKIETNSEHIYEYGSIWSTLIFIKIIGSDTLWFPLPPSEVLWIWKKEAKNRGMLVELISFIQRILIAYYHSRAEGVPIAPENTRTLVKNVTIYVILLFDWTFTHDKHMYIVLYNITIVCVVLMHSYVIRMLFSLSFSLVVTLLFLWELIQVWA